MDARFLYFDVHYAIEIHKIVIIASGGLSGVKDQGAIESILHHVKDNRYYPTFTLKLTHIVFSIIKHHAYNDGNKRTSIALGAYFLEINGFGEYVKKFIREMENTVVWVADNKINKELLHDLILSIIADDDYPETLKLRLLGAIIS